MSILDFARRRSLRRAGLIGAAALTLGVAAPAAANASVVQIPSGDVVSVSTDGSSTFQLYNTSNSAALTNSTTGSTTTPLYGQTGSAYTDGLLLGSFQNGTGSGAGNDWNDIVVPQTFDGYQFGLFTNSSWPGHSGTTYPVPALYYDTSTHQITTGSDLSSVGVNWGPGYYYQQGATFGGSTPGNDLTGTYYPSSHLITLDWQDQIVDTYGTGFNGYYGHWHIVGKVVTP